MGQMFAASSRIGSSGGSRRPPSCSAAVMAACSTASVSAATSGAAEPGPFLENRYNVSRLRTNSRRLKASSSCRGMIQVVMAGSIRHATHWPAVS